MKKLLMLSLLLTLTLPFSIFATHFYFCKDMSQFEKGLTAEMSYDNRKYLLSISLMNDITGAVHPEIVYQLEPLDGDFNIDPMKNRAASAIISLSDLKFPRTNKITIKRNGEEHHYSAMRVSSTLH